MNLIKQNRVKVGLGMLILGVLFFANEWDGWSKSNYADSVKYDSEELGFSFQYPSSLLVEVDKDTSERLFVYPKSLKGNDNEPMTAIIISTSTDDLTYMTPEEWLNGPTSGYKASRDGQYKHIKVGGQDAVITPNDWTVVKSPNGQRHISIAYFVQQDKGAEPLKREFQMIIDTFAFK